jgi:hypothetical protein
MIMTDKFWEKSQKVVQSSKLVYRSAFLVLYPLSFVLWFFANLGASLKEGFSWFWDEWTRGWELWCISGNARQAWRLFVAGGPKYLKERDDE